MKFSKSYNPNKRKAHRPPRYSAYRMEQIRDEALLLMIKAQTDKEKGAIIDAYRATINP